MSMIKASRRSSGSSARGFKTNWCRLTLQDRPSFVDRGKLHIELV
jgi:hypothetical protein